VEKANLNSSRPELPAARAKFERYKNLYQKNSISRDQLDDAEASYRSSRRT
jgi:membrane fusion protein (multidrug efflux system)